MLFRSIRSADGEEHVASMAGLDVFMESHKPFMNDVAYAQKWNSVHDTIKFKRAFNSITGEGEFDSTPFMDLNPNQVGQLEARHHGLKRESEREFREHQADRANVLLPRLEDSLASARNEGVPMDDTEEMLAELGGLGEIGAAKEAQSRAQLGLAANAWNIMDSVKNRPFGEQMQMAETLRPEPGSEEIGRAHV